MTTVVFVHGIGVRDEEYVSVRLWVRAAVQRADPAADLAFCYWGEECGARLLANGACDPTIPAPTSHHTTNHNTIEQPTDPTALWSLLDADPLFELRIMAATALPAGLLPPDGITPGRQLADRARALPVVAALAEIGLGQVAAAAVAAVLDAEPTRSALRHAAQLGDKLRLALTRSIVATAMLRAGDVDCPPFLDGSMWTRWSM